MNILRKGKSRSTKKKMANLDRNRKEAVFSSDQQRCTNICYRVYLYIWVGLRVRSGFLLRICLVEVAQHFFVGDLFKMFVPHTDGGEIGRC